MRRSLGRLARHRPSDHDETSPKPPASRRKPPAPRLAALAERAERSQALDGPARVLSGIVVRAMPPGAWTDALHGVPLGQPAHPALVRLPLGCWTSAVLLDFLPVPRPLREARFIPARFPGSQQASTVLLAIGLTAAAPSAATGLADWSALHTHQQRVGLAHAIAQTCATALFGTSLLARVTGRPRCGKALAVAGLAAVTAGSYLGGHLALRLGAGASHAEPIDHLAALGWHDLCPLAGLPDGRPARRQLGYLSVMALRQGDAVHVLPDRCAHLGGPLHQGRVVTVKGAACVACPWHGSVFRVSDGAVMHGPATALQPAFEARVSRSGWVQVRAR